MNRADKLKQYRGGYNRQKKRGRPSPRTGTRTSRGSQNIPGIGLLLLGILAVCICIFGSYLIHKKGESPALAYVTQTEFASLMSFLDQDILQGQWKKDADEAVTQQEIRDFLQSIGLSDIITRNGGNDKLDRESVMKYYDQIRDYLDIGEYVSKKNILCLKQSKNSCYTQDGKLKLKIDSLKLDDMHTYEVYVMGKEILGVRKESGKAIALKNVSVKKISKDEIVFSYQDKEYKAGCKEKTIEDSMLQENMQCTLYVKNGYITEVKDKKGGSIEGNAPMKIADTVNVLILNQGVIHYDQVYLTCDTNCVVSHDKKSEKQNASNVLSSKELKLKNGTYASMTPDKESGRIFLTDRKGKKITNGYYGSIYIYKDKEGYYIVNKVKIEKYLYSVVASEMPSYFAPEALKAQAICARSYVCRQMAGEDYREYHAQIDDSTNYQVYNKSEVVEEDIQAVESTAGLVMCAEGEIVDAYYFSTSCGYSSDMEIWNQKGAFPYLKAKAIAPPSKSKQEFDLSSEKAFQAYITKDDKNAYDKESKFFRWKATVELSSCLDELKNRIKERQTINPQNVTMYAKRKGKEKKVDSLEGFGGFKNMYCGKRGKSGAVLELVIEFEFGKVKIQSEYNIRYIVGCAMEKISYADGSADTASRFLPSAYFSISFQKKSCRFVLAGGGNGHGIGMSQYGADSMADDGWDYKQILNFYYDGIEIVKMN